MRQCHLVPLHVGPLGQLAQVGLPALLGQRLDLGFEFGSAMGTGYLRRNLQGLVQADLAMQAGLVQCLRDVAAAALRLPQAPGTVFFFGMADQCAVDAAAQNQMARLVGVAAGDGNLFGLDGAALQVGAVADVNVHLFVGEQAGA